ncbi:PREDICTED: vasoactive intestinal polypeptide receptor 2-like [Galeopterus variegatus]|uniref:Vasoactive intestinal polypeptide receptor 2-like n=1 Tax=Galeopterus variegatus TaxID=482537 RepID=A0ABM0S291_GALVR|nr:PREDICTED: vasoactive intestinal polypeptide receptor 2-like [Galeopterus variegatus]
MTGCSGVWDNITCWRPADVGETVTVPCPKVFSNFYSRPGNLSKNCTSDGWSEMFPDFIDACGYSDPEDDSKITFYVLVKAIYTLGYSVSLMSLATGSIILCLFSSYTFTQGVLPLPELYQAEDGGPEKLLVLQECCAGEALTLAASTPHPAGRWCPAESSSSHHQGADSSLAHVEATL